MDGKYEGSTARAREVRDRVESVEKVAKHLFEEWQAELELISNCYLRGESAVNLRNTTPGNGRLIQAMRKAADSVDPVLTTFPFGSLDSL